MYESSRAPCLLPPSSYFQWHADVSMQGLCMYFRSWKLCTQGGVSLCTALRLADAGAMRAQGQCAGCGPGGGRDPAGVVQCPGGATGAGAHHPGAPTHACIPAGPVRGCCSPGAAHGCAPAPVPPGVPGRAAGRQQGPRWRGRQACCLLQRLPAAPRLPLCGIRGSRLHRCRILQQVRPLAC